MSLSETYELPRPPDPSELAAIYLAIALRAAVLYRRESGTQVRLVIG